MNTRDELVELVRVGLDNPSAVVQMLGLDVSQANRSYVLVRCPMHEERTASCSVHARDRGIAVKCHGCKWTGDVFTLIAAVEGLSLRSDFVRVLARGAELAGYHDESRALLDGRPLGALPAPKPAPQRRRAEYPDPKQVWDLWEIAQPVTDDARATAYLAGRGINPMLATSLGLCRVLVPETHDTHLPGWARYRGSHAVSRAWTRTGHRLLVPAYDRHGEMRSLRAWQVDGQSDVPKRVPPAGQRADQLILANVAGVSLLQGQPRRSSVTIVEGEPDLLARSIASPGEAVLGLLSGSWHKGFAERIRYGMRVIIRTHLDDAGELYAKAVIESLNGRAEILRLQLNEEAA